MIKNACLNFIIFLFGILYFPLVTNAQEELQFHVIKDLQSTPVKNQQKTGTCWIHATLSFFESELLRTGKGSYDLSEMFVANRNYLERAVAYVRFHGKQKFSGGAEGWDVIEVIKKYGIVPQQAYSGLRYGSLKHNHLEMDAVLKGYVEALVNGKQQKLSKAWKNGFEGILTAYLGKIPEKFHYKGSEYTPKTFAKSLDLNFDDYTTIGSFTHHPFYEKFVFEGADNWAYGRIWNVPIDELMEICHFAIQNGYSFTWCSDVSDEGFKFYNGLALVPKAEESKQKDCFSIACDECKITQERRQEEFDNYLTTEDHLMHITGTLKDQNGKIYFKVKNSWGTTNTKDGFLYASESFMRLKTLSIMVHKNGIPKEIRKKLGIK